jgi:hypothetical protein
LIDIKLVEQETPHRWAGSSGIGKRFGFDPSTVRNAMGHLVKTTMLALLLLVPGDQARAAENEPNAITLSCDGMLTATYAANKSEASQPLQKTGLVVNLDEQTVFFLGYVVPIEGVGEAGINSAERRLSITVSASPSGATLIEQPAAWTQHWKCQTPHSSPAMPILPRSVMTWFASRAATKASCQIMRHGASATTRNV